MGESDPQHRHDVQGNVISPFKELKISIPRLPDSLFKTFNIDSVNSVKLPKRDSKGRFIKRVFSSNTCEITKFENSECFEENSSGQNKIDPVNSTKFQKRDSKRKFIKETPKSSIFGNSKLENSDYFDKRNSKQNKIDSANSIKAFPKTIINKDNYSKELFNKYPCVHLEKLNFSPIHEIKNNSDASQSKKNLETNFSCEEPKLPVPTVDAMCITHTPEDVADLLENDETNLLSITNTHNISEEFAKKCSTKKFYQLAVDEKLEENNRNPNLEIYAPMKKAVVQLERLNLPACHGNENESKVSKSNLSKRNSKIKLTKLVEQSFANFNVSNDAESDTLDNDVPLDHLRRDNHVNQSNFLKIKSKNLLNKQHSNNPKSMASNGENDLLLSHEGISESSTSHANLNNQLSTSAGGEYCVNKEFQVGSPYESLLKKILMDPLSSLPQKHSNSDANHAISRKNTKTLNKKEKIVAEKAHQSKQIVKYGNKASTKIVKLHSKNIASEEEGTSKRALRKKKTEVYKLLLKYLRKKIKLKIQKCHKKTKIQKNLLKKHKKCKLRYLTIDSETENSTSAIVDSSSEVISEENNFLPKETTMYSQYGVASSSGHLQNSANFSKKRSKLLDKYRLGFLSKKRILRLRNECLASERFLFSHCKLKKEEKKKLKKELKMFNKVFKFGF